MWEYLSTHALEILGVILGIVYLIFELKARWPLWIVSIIMPINSLFVYFQAGLYADFAIDIYYVLAAVYGLIVWLKGRPKKALAGNAARLAAEGSAVEMPAGDDAGKQTKSELPISKTPGRYWPIFAAIFVVLLVGIAFVLINWTNSTVPWADSFTTALSIIALWMLAQKYIEQWWVWFVVDLVSAGLYFYKGIPFYGGLYLLYTVLAVYGYFKWKRKMPAAA